MGKQFDRVFENAKLQSADILMEQYVRFNAVMHKNRENTMSAARSGFNKEVDISEYAKSNPEKLETFSVNGF